MKLLVLGLNHKTAPVDIRERLAFGPDIIAGALRDLTGCQDVSEGVILSTCNRTELYCAIEDGAELSVRHWLSQFHGIELERIDPFIYAYAERDAVTHLLRVSSGLDSLVLGEPQILGQVKNAYQTAKDCGATGKLLGRLFQHTFSVAKTVRTETAIGSNPVSVAFAAVNLARQIFSDLSQQTALLIGAGETIELAARHLHNNGIGRIIVANRTVERAHELAAQFDGFAIALTEIAGHLADADIVIASTASPLPVLGKGTVERALKKRKHRPMFMVDIAVPRDIEPEIADLNDVYLYTIDDLKEVIDENLRSRQAAAEQAEEIIAFHTEEFLAWLRSLDAAGLIQDYRLRGEALRDEVLARALRQLDAGKPPAEIVKFLAHTLTNKLLHAPSSRLRQAARDGDAEILEAANELFQLDTNNRTANS
ncbi:MULTISPECIES: glutamyl-tRNA reductase [Marichromatium]|uniref:Glutamyl-tRNA reductase n=1 Tax=Marichromatium gracile TaxID=1048 RepID=A0A4R4A6Q3_MARGR|nr:MULTISPECIES: glutamyl-tRNA reductase [Marichromatium]MBO8084706.1 glutamyl-tRNA reductase [Marichromatium sp.]KXX64524.1 glutamyl-tRNA reductase [Marichromatium gracile]MBK1708603.1 glutamyl-tRNA reductase [Marichromatium gracile]RNE89206.1 glutamyl-tRNA reductase [Marichromatium sp. AB31]RNE93549.1 glutamyl-tRNA reductase [Marichromatium sp. AB32]